MTAASTPPAPAKALIDFDEARFRLRPELQIHLGAALVAGLKRHGAKEVVVDYSGERKPMDGHTLLAVSLALAARLRTLVPEPRVGIVLPPSLGGFIINLATIFAGKTPVNLNFTIGRAALKTSLRKAGIRTTFTDTGFREKITARIPDLPWSERVLDLLTEIKALSKSALGLRLAAAKILPASLIIKLFGVPQAGGDAEAGLLFTSGSSGEPKGVVLTHRNILGNCAQIDASGILPQGESLLANLPIFHSFGFSITLFYTLLHDIKTVTSPSPLDTRKCIDAVKAEQVTVMLGTPTFLRSYLKRAEPDELKCVRIAVGGAEKTPAGFHDAWEARFGGQYCEGYGMTETSPVIAVNLPLLPGDSGPSSPPRKKAGSVGRLFPGMAARVADPETWVDLGLNQVGMLMLRGVNVFPGYLEQPDATAAAFRDGWLVTGDLVRIDADGFIFIEGRLSRFSKIGGEMIPHGTVETAINEAFGLKTSEGLVIAISARQDAAKGEALVLLSTIDISVDQLREKLSATGFANLWIPRLIKRVDAIPMLSTGKLDLRKIRELAAKD